MATNQYTSDFSIAAVRRRALLPSTGKIATADVLAFLNDSLQDYLTPMLMASREGFLHATEHTAISGTEYAIPARAASERLVRVALVAATTTEPRDEYPLNRVETQRRESGQEGFELVDNTIVLREVPTGYAYLRVVYFCVPNRLVTLAETGRVTGKNATTVTVAAAPSAFTATETYDFIAGTPGFRWRAIGKTATNLVGTTLTFNASDIPSTLAVGDYVALAGETPIAQVPVTLRPLLEQDAATRILKTLGDGRLAAEMKALEALEKRLLPTLQPRVTGAARVIRPAQTGRTVLPRVFR